MRGKKGTCKVCQSQNRDNYEKEFYQKEGAIAYSELVRIALSFGERISRKSFRNHFTKHYQPARIQDLIHRGSIDSKVEEGKIEAINILDEIKTNLLGLKALMTASKKSKNVSDLVAVYREHRLTLQDIERLSNRLSVSTSLTKAELYKEIYWACSQLCPKCRDQFWVKLDERLRSKGFT